MSSNESEHNSSHMKPPTKRGELERRIPITAKEWYEINARNFAANYEQFKFEDIHYGLIKFLPKKPCIVLDVGAGTGRDAAGLAQLGHDVTAVEPSEALRNLAISINDHASINWLNDSLPKLNKVRHTGLRYDVILLSAVWMHVAPSHRQNTFRRLVTLLNPNGLLCITLRHGPYEPIEGFWDIPDEDVRALARDFGLFEVECSSEEDRLHREGVHWTRMIFRLPGDGTGALPLLRGIVLNDNKSSTYKLALLRVLVRISQSTGGMVRIESDDFVVLPLGLFALFWLRLYRPLLDLNLPQSPTNSKGTERLGFAKTSFEHLSDEPTLNFRVGMRFSSDTARQLHFALRDICRTLTTMPMYYTTFPGSTDQVFVANSRLKEQGRSVPTENVLDEAYLYSFGEVRIPTDIWQAVQKYGVWIEPAIVGEWKTLMKRYARSQGRTPLNLEKMETALLWIDPNREVRVPRIRAQALIENGTIRHCVWSGKRLQTNNVDIDHCFPFSAWPCDDLWNLLASHRYINQKDKREKLPSRNRLQLARERILEWWQAAYVKDSNLRNQFFTEASSSLRILSDRNQDLESVFDSLTLQQTHLKFNQQIPEWNLG